jgi:hypothetical protein
MSARLKPSDAVLRSTFIGHAMKLLGPSRYAEAMGVQDRSARAWAAGQRGVSDQVLRETQALLVAHRQETANLIRTIRAHLGDEGEDAADA